MADELTHWIAFRELRPVAEAPRPMPWHEFARALLDTRPIRRGRSQLLRGLNEWKNSIYEVELQLVYIVEEPLDDDPDTAKWPVRVRVRSGTDSPRPVSAQSLDRASVEKLREAHRKAVRIAPTLGRPRSCRSLATATGTSTSKPTSSPILLPTKWISSRPAA